ncbi:uncharacterized protein LOC132732327 isoform X2 [Ruditapes philippinarum]|uniref:uncharacterized protein LOC132732327 isoform X2 n=1 Tax=Ruditapes philippinarum TaxID=129788 RepID=UPI00295BA8A7|nr:uncharacterized protein LOC132732327 isoform X2 [Ruditapes philippinarum]
MLHTCFLHLSKPYSGKLHSTSTHICRQKSLFHPTSTSLFSRKKSKIKEHYILILIFSPLIILFFFVGYDQPEDGYTDKNAKYGLDAPPPYQPGIPPPQQGYGQQPYPMQSPYGHNTVVVNQPQTGTIIIIQRRHTDYMVSSIFACLCCFWPTGICAIYYANEANNLARDGDYEGARKMSDMARRLMVASVIVGVISLFFAVVKCLTVYESYKSSSYKY